MILNVLIGRSTAHRTDAHWYGEGKAKLVDIFGRTPCRAMVSVWVTIAQESRLEAYQTGRWCALWWGVVVHGVKVAGVVGDGVAVSVCALMPLGVWLLMVCGCSDRGEGVAVCVACLLVS